VDVPTTMTVTQLTLIWILLGCLSLWMIFFALLALRPDKSMSKDNVSTSIPSHARTTTSTPAMLHALATTPAVPKQMSTGPLSQEVKDSHSMPVSL
jgi:hypothetical protein